MTADCRDDMDIKKQFSRQNAVGNMLVRKFSFAPIEAKIQLFRSYCYPIYGCALWRHSYQNSIRKLTVCYSDIFTHLIGGRQGRVPEPTQQAEIRNSAVTDSRHQITALDGCCKVRLTEYGTPALAYNADFQVC